MCFFAFERIRLPCTGISNFAIFKSYENGVFALNLVQNAVCLKRPTLFLGIAEGCRAQLKRQPSWGKTQTKKASK